jgi:single-strand DNA-binding protein
MSVNKVTLVGNLGKDPILKKFDNGRAVAQFTLATNERYKDKTGNPVTKTEWHNIVMWTPLAEIAEKYLKKGNQVFLEGKIESREYQDTKDNSTKRITEIIVRDMTLLGGPNNSGGSNESAPIAAEPGYVATKNSAPVPLPVMESGTDDLPF